MVAASSPKQRQLKRVNCKYEPAIETVATAAIVAFQTDFSSPVGRTAATKAAQIAESEQPIPVTKKIKLLGCL